jgi:hypothetical protein
MTTDNINTIGNAIPGPSIIPGRMEKPWDNVNYVQKVVNNFLSALDNIQNFTSKFAEVPKILSEAAGTVRVCVAISLPFRLVNMANSLVAIFKGRKDDEGNIIQPRLIDVCELVSEIGNLMDDFSTFVGAIDKITKLSATVNAVAQWIGFAGVVLQVAGAAVDGYMIDKGVEALKDLKTGSVVANTAQKITHLKAVTNLKEKKIDAIKNKEGAIEHLKKRIHFDISLRTIGIVFAVLAVVAICLTTFGVGAVVTVGVGIFAALAASQLLLMPIKGIVNYAFKQEYKSIANAAAA